MRTKPLSLRFIVSATLLGNTLEWYDIASIGFLVPLFAKLFFPENNPSQALFYTMLVVFFGTLTRPFGGILFGFIGDRFGRRIALLSSVLFMTIPALLIGLLPTYLQIGAAAPILLSIFRLLQGVAAGGELPGAITFLCESAKPKNKGFYGSFAYFGVGLGILLGGIDFFFLQSHFSEQAFIDWGWRVIFLMGAVLGLSAFLMRRKLHETSPFETMRETHEILKDPVWMLLKRYKKSLIKVMGISVLETVAFNLTIPFAPIYLSHFLNIPFHKGVRLNLLALIIIVLGVPFAGKLASKIGSKKLGAWTCCSFLIFTIPLYRLMHYEIGQIIATAGLALLMTSYWGSMPAVVTGLFPSSVRFSGIGIGYNLTIGLIGGYSPILALDLINKSGSTMAPAIMLLIAALISLIALKSVPAERGYSS